MSYRIDLEFRTKKNNPEFMPKSMGLTDLKLKFQLITKESSRARGRVSLGLVKLVYTPTPNHSIQAGTY